jgi:dTDP-4-dehydrorhamnose 3,5-epimerase
MEIIETPLKDCYLVKNRIFNDGRGYFFESFHRQKFADITGWQGEFVQDNQSHSEYGVVRGLHFQQGSNAQAKLVRVLKGRVIDVALDLRRQSPTFGQWYAVELSEDNNYQLYIPRGFAHGFSVISPQATFFYKCDNYYNKASEGGIHPMDKTLNIDWGIAPADVILSDKDKNAKSWNEIKNSK